MTSGPQGDNTPTPRRRLTYGMLAIFFAIIVLGWVLLGQPT